MFLSSLKKHVGLWGVLLAFLCLITPAAAQDQLAPDGKPREIYYAPFPLTMTLDGDFSDWAGVPMVTIPDGADLTSGNPAITFAAAADDQFIYLMGDVIDSNVITGQHAENYWNEDSVEFYLNGTGDLTLESYEDGVAQMTIPPLNILQETTEAIIGGVQGGSVGAQLKLVATETGYAVEMAVPLQNDVWNIAPAHGKILGFQVHVNGASTSDRDSKLIWSAFDAADSSYQDPSVFGFLVFYEIGQTEIPNIEETIAVETLPREADPLYVPVNAAYKNPALSTDERVEDLLARMTLEEKIGQMTLVEKDSIADKDITDLFIGGLLSGGGGSPRPNNAQEWANMVRDFQERALQTRLGIPLIYGVDAVHGHNNLYGATIFPHNIGLGATNNPALVQEVCRITAAEMIGTGIYWNYSPVIAVPQDIRWGRTYEGYSENTELVTLLGTACLEGLQGEGLGTYGSVLGTPKHYIGDGGTTWGTSTTENYQIDQGQTLVDEETLRTLYFPPYQAAIDAGAMSIMTSFSSWNDTKMHAEAYLVNEVLKGEMGFQGFIVSDWAGIDQISSDYYEAVVTSINAGVDMNMVPYDYNRFIEVMLEAVEKGDISEERIDDAVRRILRAKFEMGLFEWAFEQPEFLAQVGSAEHRAVAQQAVSESLVLLKNENEALPIAADTPTIFVAGDAADDIGMQSGGWTISWQGSAGEITEGTTILEGIQATASPDSQVYFDKLGRFIRAVDANDQPLRAEIGIVVVGEVPYAEGRGDDGDLSLSERDLTIINRVRERVDKLIIVLVSGRPMVINEALETSDAFVAAWLPGTEGQGVADNLFGLQPFTGTLPFTWIRSNDQLPQAGVEDPLFPLGYGLSN